MNRTAPPDHSSTHIDLVRAMNAAFVQGDIPGVLDLLSPDVEWGEPDNPHNPAAGTRYGHAGFLEWARIGRQAEEILALEPPEFLANADSVAVVGHTRCLARPTGKTYETDFVHLGWQGGSLPGVLRHLMPPARRSSRDRGRLRRLRGALDA